MDWISDCCSAEAMFSVDVLNESEAVGLCSSCKEHCSFNSEDNDE